MQWSHCKDALDRDNGHLLEDACHPKLCGAL